MTAIKRLAVALAVGLAQAVFVWTVSTIYDFPRVWPGTLLVFALGTLTVLAVLAHMPRGGRR